MIFPTLESETSAFAAGVLPMAQFRAAAIAGAGAGDPGAFANSSAAFREALAPDAAHAFMLTLAEIGEIGDATSIRASRLAAGTRDQLHRSAAAEIAGAGRGRSRGRRRQTPAARWRIAESGAGS